MNWPAGPGGGSSGTEFYRTGMGHRFFNATMPELVKQLRRLGDQIEGLREDLAKARKDPQDLSGEVPDEEEEEEEK